MPVLEGVVFSSKDMLSPFACDVSRCKGACCFIEGELGAPLKHNEINLIDSIVPIVWELLPEKSKKVILQEGWWVKRNGNYYTNVVANRECVFVYFEDGIARCSIEKCFHQGKINFRKPISCHLFPLREYSFFISELVYVKIPECKVAIENGMQQQVRLFETLKDALIRRFGERWYKTLVEKEICVNTNEFPKSGG
ncbi:MAG: DUF3109 family protein [Ignavibacteria bacterium]|nr:DUF3109 family protein [Ignavibacteria bacterium]